MKIQYKSDSQVKAHIARSGGKSETMAHEAKESKGFEKAEHRIGGAAYNKRESMSKGMKRK